MRINRIK